MEDPHGDREQRIRDLSRLAEVLDPSETPFTARLGPIRPLETRARIYVSVEPFATLHREMKAALDQIRPAEDDDEEQEQFYTPSPGMMALEQIESRLYRMSQELIPNPDYDPEAAARWEAEHPGWGGVRATKVEWGTREA